MTNAINFVAFFIATTCGPVQSQNEDVHQQPSPSEISITDDAFLNSFDVDANRLETVGRIA